MYKLMNGVVWKIVDQGDGTALIMSIEPGNPEYEAALAAAQLEQNPA
jgi:hypothetical protein